MNEPAMRQDPGDRLLAAPAVYYCDLAHDDQPRLALGYVVELVLPPYHGLGLVARKQLAEDEVACMDEIGRRLLIRPFDYLHDECDRIRRSAEPGCAIADLSAAHHTSLKIAPPQETGRPRTLTGIRGRYTAATVLGAVADLLVGYEAIDRPVGFQAFCDMR